MSLPQSTFSKRAAPALSLNLPARVTSLQVESVSSNKENYPEAFTPQLPKKTMFNSRNGLSLKKPSISSLESTQETNNTVEMTTELASPLPPLELPEFIPPEPKSALLRKKKPVTSYTGDENPVIPVITEVKDVVPLDQPAREFNEELYHRAEEYLDSQHLVIVLPEDHRRRPFGNLRVSTAKVFQSDSTAVTEYNSPSLISPSIHTSSLFVRRSSSKKTDADSSPKQKLMIAKSPFYPGKRLFGGDTTVSKEASMGNEEDCTQDNRQSPKKGLNVITSLNLKFNGMSLRASREPSEASSATSLKMEESSPLPVIA